MIEQTMSALRSAVTHRVWLFSDLQQADPVKSRACLTIAVDDFNRLALPCDQIWYLGDAVEGANPEAVQEMTNTHLELLEPLRIPLRYVMGNHDFDLIRRGVRSKPADGLPFYEAVRHTPGWRSLPEPQAFYFLDTIGDYAVVFLSDHCAPEAEWWTTGGRVEGPAAHDYPHGEHAYKELSERIAALGKDVIIASHYAFAGGNRPSALLNQMLPLPGNVRVHFHGHAHIGDSMWAGDDCYRKIGFTERQPIPQINVSSLENGRGDRIRSVILELYEDGSMGVYFREHDRARWSEMYMLAPSEQR